MPVSNGDLLTLGVNDIHVWQVAVDQVNPENISRFRSIMSASELERNQRYRFEKNRFADCVTRALLRTTLSKYAPRDSAQWAFTVGDHGKPEIATPPIPLRFNLSHTTAHIVCAVTPEYDLGIDIEDTLRTNDVLAIADRYFSEAEMAELQQLSNTEQKTDRFFDYWTLKEAYMKASGEGISLGLGNFSFSFAAENTISISFGEKLQDDPSQWCFKLTSPSDNHRMAVAVRCGSGVEEDLVINYFDTIPLVD